MLKEGDFVAGYQIVQELGKGGMARVYRARKVGLGDARKAVALKVMLEHVSGDPRYREMFLREARIAMMLNSPNIVQVFEADEDPVTGQLFMAMEWVQGHNLGILRTMLEQRGDRLPLELSAYVIGEVLAALDYAHNVYADGHATGLIHRDVTPQNVLIGHDGSVKLADFGVARVASDESTAGVKGKLRYMAKEHLTGKATQQSDLFGVGAMFHELLTGQRFRNQADEEPQLFGEILNGDTWRQPIRVPDPSMAGLLRPLPPELRTLLDGLLAPEESERFESAAAALEVLEAWEGYRPRRRVLAKFYGQLFGEAATRTVTGGTAFHQLDLSDPEIQRRRAELLSQRSAAASRPHPQEQPIVGEPVAPTMALGEPGSNPAVPGTIALPPPQAAAVDMAATRTSTSAAFAHESTSAGQARRSGKMWLWLGMAIGVVVLAVGSGLLFAALSTPDSAGSPIVAAPVESEPKDAPVEVAVAIPEPAGPIIPEPEARGSDEPLAADEDEAADAEEDEPPEAEAKPEAVAKSQPAAKPKPVSSKPATQPKPKPTPSADADAPPRMVHIRLSEMRAAYVKIGSKEHVVEPRLTVKLKPGRYPMTWRASKSESWRPSKTFSIGAHEDEWVVLVQPSGIDVKTLKQHLGR